MNSVLVTGGAGYVGSHVCKALSNSGYLPVAYDNLVYGHERAVIWGPLEHGDICDMSRLSDVLRKHHPIAVIHLAAYAYVGESVSDPAKYYQNNVLGTLALLDAMRNEGVNRLIFSSSCATYGTPDEIPITENAVQRPINPYGATKLMAERILDDYRSAYGLKRIALRYFNAAGADAGGEIGEDHDPETHLIPLILDAAKGTRDAVVIHGNDYPTPDGTCIRDYVHVSDIANAHILALKNLDREPPSPAYNLGTGKGASVLEFINAARAITGRPINLVVGPRRQGDPPRLVADPSLAQKELGWMARHSSIENIIATAWNWHSGKRNSRARMRA